MLNGHGLRDPKPAAADLRLGRVDGCAEGNLEVRVSFLAFGTQRDQHRSECCRRRLVVYFFVAFDVEAAIGTPHTLISPTTASTHALSHSMSAAASALAAGLT